jgi:hypothetical protein
MRFLVVTATSTKMPALWDFVLVHVHWVREAMSLNCCRQ